MLDSIVDQAYAAARIGYVFVFWFQELAMSKFPNGPIVIMTAHVTNAALAVHAANKGKPRQYWLHSLVNTILACFGGGIIVPVIMAARPSIILANDLALTLGFLIWYLINYCGFDAVFNWKPIKLLTNLTVALWRTNGTMNNVNLGVASIKPGPYYPTPLFGPLIGGTLVNCLGAFVPFDKGLTPISKGMHWNMQSAFVSAALYYFIVKDRDGWIGMAVRSVVGDLSQRTVAAGIVALQMLTLGSQVIFDDPDANFLTPIHEAIYYVTGMQGPIADKPVTPVAMATTAVASTPPARVEPNGHDSSSLKAKGLNRPAGAEALTVTTVSHAEPKKKKSAFPKFALFVRLVACAAFGIYCLSQYVPPVSLPAVKITSTAPRNGADYVTLTAVPTAGLSVDRPIGNCQWKSILPVSAESCAPFALRLEEHHVCSNSTCTALPAECVGGGGSCAVAALKGKQAEAVQFRLVLHPGAHAAHPALVRSASKKEEWQLNEGKPWVATLPLSVTSAEQLATLDPQFQFNKVSLFLTTDSELLLVSDVDFAGSIFDPTQISARVLWRGMPRNTCDAKVGAEALYLDAASGVPHVRCADGSTVALSVGTVHRSAQSAQVGMKGLGGSSVVPSTVKMEL